MSDIDLSLNNNDKSITIPFFLFEWSRENVDDSSALTKTRMQALLFSLKYRYMFVDIRLGPLLRPLGWLGWLYLFINFNIAFR